MPVAPYYCIARPQELWFERLDFGILAIWPGYPLRGVLQAAWQGQIRGKSFTHFRTAGLLPGMTF
jgi:hypothetical protein